MKKSLKTVLFLSAALLLLVGLCTGASAAEMLDEEYGAFVNSVYADVLTEESLSPLRIANGPEDEFDPDDYPTDPETVVSDIRAMMVHRDAVIAVKIRSDNPDGEEVCRQLFDAVIAHTGCAWEGDYLRYTCGGCQFSVDGWQTEDGCYYSLIFAPTYFTNLDQEDYVDEEVTAVLDEILTEGMTDYEKVSAIYQYITANVTYDYANLADGSCTLKFTAYAALHDGTAVCQGYANLFYRMALEAGVDDVRIVSGVGGDEGHSEPHAWSIVRLNGRYYNLDATWDAGQEEYAWFLRCDENFPQHVRDEEYETDDFLDAHPMAERDYLAPGEWETECPDGSARLDTEDNRFGTDSWESNPDVAFDQAFDGDVDTYYDAMFAADPNMYIGTDLGEGESARLTRVDIYPRIDCPERMRGLRIQGSPDGLQWLTLLTVPEDIYVSRTYTATLDDFDEELRDMQFRAFRITNYDEHLSAAEVAFYGDEEGEPMNLNEAYYKLVPTMEMVERNNRDNDLYWQEDGGWFFFCEEDTYEDGRRVTYRGTFGDEETYFITESYLPYHEDGNYVIPGEYNDKIIAGIGVRAFHDCKDIRNLVISENICWIEYCAFQGCDNMVTCAIPESLRWAHGLAWANCYSFEEFLYTGDWIEKYPTDDEYYRAADTRGGRMMRIHDGVLYMCHDSDLVRYPNNRPAENGIFVVPNVIAIRSYAFQDTVSLKSVVIPHVERIEWNAFACSDIEYIAIPASLNLFEGDVFIDCWNLKKVIALNWWADGAMEDNWDYNPEDPNWNEESEVYRFRNMDLFSRENPVVVSARKDSRWDEYVTYLQEQGFAVTFEEREYPGWLYGVNEWDKVEIYGYYDNTAVLEIPAEIDGMPVVRVNQLVHSVDYEGAELVRDLIFPEADIFIENWLYNDEPSGLETVTLPAGSHYLNLATFNNCGSLTDVYYTGEWLDVEAYGWGYADDEFRIREDGKRIRLHCFDGCEINFKHFNIENGEIEFGDYSIDDNPYLEVIRDVDAAMEVKPISSVEVYTDPLYPGRTIEDFGVWCRDGRYHITDYELNGKQPFVEGETCLLAVRLAPNDGYEFGEFVEVYGNGSWVDSVRRESEESVVVELSLRVGYSSMEKAVDALGLEPITDGYHFVDGSYGFEGEEAWNLWDNNPETKFCTNELTAWSYIELDEPTSINGVILTTANDSEEFRGRLPGEWRIFGSHDGENWDEVYWGNDHEIMDTNSLSYALTFAPSAPYRYYSFEAYWTDSGHFQLADMTLCKAGYEISSVSFHVPGLYPGDGAEDFEIGVSDGRCYIDGLGFLGEPYFADGGECAVGFKLIAKDGYGFAPEVEMMLNGAPGRIEVRKAFSDILTVELYLPIGYAGEWSIWDAAAGMGLEPITSYEFVDGSFGHDEEGPESLWDGNVNTKFCTNSLPVYSVVRLAEPTSISGVILTTANDHDEYPGRLPGEWIISGSNNGEDWDEIYFGNASAMMDTNFLSYPVMFEEESAPYLYYRFEALWTVEPDFQLSEVTLCKAADEEPGESAVVLEATAEQKTAVTGSDYTFDIVVSGSFDGFSFLLDLPQGLNFREARPESIRNTSVDITELANGELMLSVIGGCDVNDTERLKLATVVLSVDPDAAVGKQTIGLKNVSFSDEYGDKISAVQVNSLVIDLVDFIPGDINGDGLVDYYDVAKIYACYRGKAVISNTLLLDVNKDGVFDYYDVSKLYAFYRGKTTLPN